MSYPGKDKRQFPRLTRSQRIQHAVLFISTGLLIVTGFMMQADRWFIDSLGTASDLVFWWRGWIHRISGVLVTCVCLYHLVYVVVTAEGNSWFKDMLPGFKDLTDACENILYMVGVREARPKMGRFMYLEKLEYWSVYFGFFVVITSGFVMWTEYLWPKFYLDVAGAFHMGEATLAALAIIIGHIFSVHYNPHAYPMNRAFIDGMISEDLMKEEHGSWYERQVEKSDSTEKGDNGDA